MATRNSACATAQAGIPVLWLSSPGQGKSAWVEGLAAALRGPAAEVNCRLDGVETLIGSQIDPCDVGGIMAPDLARQRGVFLLPDWFIRLQEAGRGILFLDELSSAPQSVQAALLRVLRERAIHGHRLPANVLMFAASNPVEEAANGQDLAPAMANRLAHYSWAVDAQEWAEGLLSGWPVPSLPVLPADWRKGLSSYTALVAGYIRRSPSSLNSCPKDAAKQSGPWPSGRTWEYVALASAAHASVALDAADAVVALVGEGAGHEYLSWVREQTLVDPEAVLAAPDAHPLPDREDTAYVACRSVVGAAMTSLTAPRWEAAWIWLGRVAEAGQLDLAAPAARQLASVKQRPKGSKTPKGAAKFLSLCAAGGTTQIFDGEGR
jgi:hypothetical protein